jgi:hypothetical protein
MGGKNHGNQAKKIKKIQLDNGTSAFDPSNHNVFLGK